MDNSTVTEDDVIRSVDVFFSHCPAYNEVWKLMKEKLERYEKQVEVSREEALTKLAEQAQELDMGY